MEKSFGKLNRIITHCRKCPRLVAYRESVVPKPAFKDEEYWKRPLPGFGDEKAWLLILGLAPAAHGGNRTGRVLTGDLTAKFLFKNLYQAGFSNQPFSEYADDGLKLYGCYLTAAVKCAPPKDKPERQEFLNCYPYLENELYLLKNLKAVMVMGKFAFDAFLFYARTLGVSTKGVKFFHGAKYDLPGLPTLYSSYHPSPRNTNTGRLTDEMLIQLLEQIKLDKKGF